MGKKQPLTITFACRESKASKKTGEAPIECFVSVDGERERFSLPKKAFPNTFRTLYDSTEPNDINIFCKSVKSKINTIQTQLFVNSEPITAARIVDIYQNGAIKKSYTFKDMWNGFHKQKMDEGIEPHTWNKYNNVYELFLESTGHKETDEVSSATNADIQRYEATIRKKCADTTSCKMLKNLKAFFAYAVACGKLHVNPFGNKKIGHGTSEKGVDYLTYDEIQAFKAVEVSTDRLWNVRTVFLWQCFTGQNYSDMKILKEGDVQYDSKNDQYYIEKARYKTGRYGKEHYYKAVLFEDAIQIYQYYGEKLPLISQAKYNDYLDEIIKLTAIDKHITSKSGRKTYACYLTNTLGIDDYNVLRVMLGHENIRQTQEYVEVFKEKVLGTVGEKQKERTKKWIEKTAKNPEQKKILEILEGINE